MRIAVIGAGRVGTALGTALQGKGHRVSYGVRLPQRSPAGTEKTVADAVAGAQIVIIATPWTATESIVCQHAPGLAGKIVIDATNPLHSDGQGLAVGFDTSGAEMLQLQAPNARFFKAFNMAGAGVLADPHYPAGRAVMCVAGPDGLEKARVMELVEDIGFEPLDAGPLKAARLLEPLALLILQIAQRDGDPSLTLLAGRRSRGGRRHARAALEPLGQLGECPG